MFNRKQFQNKLYSIVRRDVNEACLELLKGDRKKLQADAIQIQRQVIYTMNWIAEQTVVQIGNGLLLNKPDK